MLMAPCFIRTPKSAFNKNRTRIRNESGFCTVKTCQREPAREDYCPDKSLLVPLGEQQAIGAQKRLDMRGFVGRLRAAFGHVSRSCGCCGAFVRVVVQRQMYAL